MRTAAVAFMVVGTGIFAGCSADAPTLVTPPPGVEMDVTLGPPAQVTVNGFAQSFSRTVYPREPFLSLPLFGLSAYDAAQQYIPDATFRVASSNPQAIGAAVVVYQGRYHVEHTFGAANTNVTITASSPNTNPTASLAYTMRLEGAHHASISPTSASLSPSQVLQLSSSLFTVSNVNITSNYANFGLQTWTSSNPSVATVSSAGKVTAVDCGQTTVTSRFADQYGSADAIATISVPNCRLVVNVSGPTQVREYWRCTYTRTVSGGLQPYSDLVWYSDGWQISNPSPTITLVMDLRPDVGASARDAAGQFASHSLNISYSPNAPLDPRCTES